MSRWFSKRTGGSPHSSSGEKHHQNRVSQAKPAPESRSYAGALDASNPIVLVNFSLAADGFCEQSDSSWECCGLFVDVFAEDCHVRLGVISLGG